MKTAMKLALALSIIGATAATAQAARYSDLSTQEKLQAVLDTHYFTNQTITPAIREAAGASLLRDNRVFDEPSRCSFVYSASGEKQIVCESL